MPEPNPYSTAEIKCKVCGKNSPGGYFPVGNREWLCYDCKRNPQLTPGETQCQQV